MNVSWTGAWPFLFVHFCPPQPPPPTYAHTPAHKPHPVRRLHRSHGTPLSSASDSVSCYYYTPAIPTTIIVIYFTILYYVFWTPVCVWCVFTLLYCYVILLLSSSSSSSFFFFFFFHIHSFFVFLDWPTADYICHTTAIPRTSSLLQLLLCCPRVLCYYDIYARGPEPEPKFELCV